VQEAASEMRANSSSSFLTVFFIQPLKQKSNGVRSVDSNSPISVTVQNYTHDHLRFSSHINRYDKLVKILTFPPESFCIYIQFTYSTHLLRLKFRKIITTAKISQKRSRSFENFD
jgi:hypothetical protein